MYARRLLVILALDLGIFIAASSAWLLGTTSLAAAPASPAAELVLTVGDAAASCGVYGIEGSPAAVVLHPTDDGRVARVELESDIFGGHDAESCIRERAGDLRLPRPSRVELPVVLTR